MLKDNQRVRNIVHNVVEELKKDFNGEIFFKIFLDGVKFIIIYKKDFHEVDKIDEVFISHASLWRYKDFYTRCLWQLRYDFIQ